MSQAEVLADLQSKIGSEIHVSDWHVVDQAQINNFADATGDHQWIHVDPERAAKESPYGATIAHGYLTLALTPHLLDRVLRIDGWSRAVNTGLERLRLASPVPAGARVRMLAEIKDTRSVAGGGVRVGFAVRIEVEGATKPALLATVNYVYFP